MKSVKNCPKCDGVASAHSGTWHGICVHCTVCGLVVPVRHCESLDRAVKAWNEANGFETWGFVEVRVEALVGDAEGVDNAEEDGA